VTVRSIVADLHTRLRRPATKHTLLQVAGFGCLSVAAGMWLLPVGVAVAGLSLLVMSGLLE